MGPDATYEMHRAAAVRLSANDERSPGCPGCHGGPVRSNLGSDPDWPGAFGANESRVTDEQVAILEDLDAAPRQPR